MSEIFLCVLQEKKILSTSVYFSDYGKIELSETFMHRLDFSLISNLTYLYNPKIIIAPASSSEDFKEIFTSLNVLYLPKSDFNYTSSRELIISKVYGNDEFLALTSLNFSRQELISSCGALLKFLISSDLRVYSISYSASNGLFIDFNTLESLQIIQEDSHPSNINNIGKAKEGLSILALMDNTFTPQGKKKLKETLLRPFNSRDKIEERLGLLNYFLSNISAVYDIIPELKSFSDLEFIIKKFRDIRHTGGDWEKLVESLKCFLSITKKLGHLPDPPLIINTLCGIKSEAIFNLIRMLESCLIFQREKPKIQPGISAELDYLLKIHNDLNEFLTKLVLIEKKELISLNFDRLSIIFMQGIGYLVEVLFKNHDFPSNFEINGYSFQFSNENSLFFKSPRTIALDTKFGDIQSKIRDAENSVLLRLETEILSLSETMIFISQIIAELDMLFSLTLFSENYKLVCPKIAQNQVVQVVNARHLLVEMCVNNYIPNDCALDFEHRVGVITGPNFSGKSVYMKTIGIIVYLAHIGCFVPAEIAEVGVFSSFFSMIHCQESRNFSSFSEEISKVAIALNNSVSNTFLIIDEFGKGTCEIDGMSLFASLISYFEKNTNLTVLISTHYSDLFINDIVNESNITQFYTMKMANFKEPVFLYKLVKGLCTDSFGIWCAKNAGIDEEIVQRAEIIKTQLQKGIKRPNEKIFEIFDKVTNENDIDLFIENLKTLVNNFYSSYEVL